MTKTTNTTTSPKKSGPSRKKRNSLERKSLSKESKRMYACTHGFSMKTILAAEKDARKKGPVSLAAL